MRIVELENRCTGKRTVGRISPSPIGPVDAQGICRIFRSLWHNMCPMRGLARLARGKAWGRFGQSYGRRGFRPWGDPSASRSADLPSCKRTFWQVMGELLLQVICQLSFKSLNRRATTSNRPVGLCKKTSATSAHRHGAPLRGDGFI